MANFLIFGERSLTLVAATLRDFKSAERAKRALKREPSLDGEGTLIGPNDELAARKMEPEQAGFWKTLVRSHLVLGVSGAPTMPTSSAG